MFKFKRYLHSNNIKSFFRHFVQSPDKTTSYTNTINLPKTKFPLRLSSKKRQEIEKNLVNSYFKDLYTWQSENLKSRTFVLHDGPPYANGNLHIGHAINKILKDMILRYHISEGKQISYKPGWDCHGLPIELKSMQDQSECSPLLIRQKARKFAIETYKRQKEEFKEWGIIGDWENARNLYKTIDPSYIKNELGKFYELYKNGFIYRDLKPVHWSPSSKTALAEAELEYDNNFESISTIIRFKMNKIPKIVKNKTNSKSVYALIWTTTPWTLPANQAVCFNKDLEYVLFNFDDEPSNTYIVANELLHELNELLKRKSEIMLKFHGILLADSTYFHPINKTVELPFLNGKHVQSSKGTGLVHTAPSHGPDDFLVSLEYKIPVTCIVDENGNYTNDAPSFLVGKNVLTDGNELVLNNLRNGDILQRQLFIHSYPIDWRTKKPIIFRASKQWFLNTQKIKNCVAEKISNIKFYPQISSTINENNLKNQILKRPYWCISRQRSWGVPIPVFYNKKTNEPIVNSKIIAHICDLIDENETIDFWWTKTVEELIPKNCLQDLDLTVDEIIKETDILDIWFDSGLSWSSVLSDDKIADLYLEGVDQCTGWFQSSLVTSIALREQSPFKSVFIHGFAVDEKGLKMSKSLGNIIEPNELIKNYGIDCLRWWIASHATQHSNIIVSKNLLESSGENLQRIRSVLKYLLGVMKNIDENQTKTSDLLKFDMKSLTILDKNMLHSLYKFNNQIIDSYKFYEFNKIVMQITNFISNDLSSLYLHLVKDRLYCDSNENYINLTNIFRSILFVLSKNLWSLSPFLIEEMWSYYDKNPFYTTQVVLPDNWIDTKSSDIISKSFELKRLLYQNLSGVNTWNFNVEITTNEDNMNILQNLHSNSETDEYINNSELCEILQVSSIKLIQSTNNDYIFKITENINNNLCPRCRRYTIKEHNQSICLRCSSVLQQQIQTKMTLK